MVLELLRERGKLWQYCCGEYVVPGSDGDPVLARVGDLLGFTGATS